MFKTANSGSVAERMRIDNTGNVGIGTTDPGALVEISKVNNGEYTALKLQNRDNGVNDNVALEMAAALIATPAKIVCLAPGNNDQDLAFHVTNSNVSSTLMYLDGSGMVGIGTTAPVYALTLKGDDSSPAVLSILSGTQSTNADGLVIEQGVGTGDDNAQIFNWENGYLRFGTNAAERIRIAADGKVGIGTTAPTELLHVYSKSDPTDNYQGQLQIGGNHGVTNDEYLSIGTYQTGQYAFLQAASSGVGPIPLVLQNHGGNVGIGTTAPTSTLHVNGSLSKTSGSFDIPHPDPVKKETGYRLRHCFVESPTRGDNLYRYRVQVNGGAAVVELPDYFKHLNEDVQVWVSAEEHFGRAYGKVNPGQTIITVKADTDGIYNVLAVGTRKDELARDWFDEDGVEYVRETPEVLE